MNKTLLCVIISSRPKERPVLGEDTPRGLRIALGNKGSISGSGKSLGEGNSNPPQYAQTVKRLPTMRETRVQSLGWEDPMEK